MVYENGLYFDSCLADNIKELNLRVKRNKASMIILTGGVGEGKTTLLVHILDYINKINGLPEIDLEESTQLGMGGAEFVRRMRECHNQKLPCVGYDEAGDFNKRGALTNFNAMLNRVFDTFRAFRCIVVVALPNFNVLDQDLFDKNIPRLLVRVSNRNKKWGNYNGYSLYRALLLKSKMKKLQLKNFAYSIITPNFRGHFLNLPKERCEQLDRLSTKSKVKILTASEIKLEGLYSYTDIALKINRSVSYVRKTCLKLKIKHKRIIKKTKYFDDSAINKLLNVMGVASDGRWKFQNRKK